VSPPPDQGPVDAPVHDPPLPHEQGPAGERLRAVMRHVASPVTIVTAASGEEYRGATIGSFTSVSLAPPLVSFNVTRGSGLHDALRRADRFAVHLLRDDQAPLAEHFAQPDVPASEQFAGVALRAPLASGQPPLLEHAGAVLHCRIRERVPAGDHDVVLGEVEAVEADPDDSGRPLLYFARSYRAVGPEV
jgi:3-hydroxy-9,10-secoandrosta-1,3,5(10)-triene-9,17-dione monooxygenase reductase component